MNEVNQGIDSTPVKPAKKRFSMGGSGGQMAQMGVGMGVSALSTLPMMMGKDNIMGVSSEFTMMTGMATGQVASFSSMLGKAGPYVAGFAAVAGVAAFAMEAYTKSLEKASDEAFKLGASLGGAAGAADTMSAALGKATAIEKRKKTLSMMIVKNRILKSSLPHLVVRVVLLWLTNLLEPLVESVMLWLPI